MGQALSEVSAELISSLCHLFPRSAPSERVQRNAEHRGANEGPLQ